jgi:hypothetical protein
LLLLYVWSQGFAGGTPSYMPPQYASNYLVVHQLVALLLQTYGLQPSPELLQILAGGIQTISLQQAQGYDFFSAAVMALEMLLAQVGDRCSRLWGIPGWLPLAPLLNLFSPQQHEAAMAECWKLVDPWAPAFNTATLYQGMGQQLGQVPQGAEPLLGELLEALLQVLRSHGQEGRNRVLAAAAQLIQVLPH